MLLAVAAAALAVVMFWPLVMHLGTDIPKDLGDPLPQAWQVAWGGFALGHQPLDYFQSNQFWPLANTLAFSDALIGYAPTALVGRGPGAAVARYDLLFLFAYALAFAGAHLLARELGAPPWAAAVAGAAFAFAPWRLEQNGHLHVISSGGIPLTLFLLLRGWRRRRPGLAYAGWLVAAWQLSLGWTLGLPLAYLLAACGVIATVAWWRAAPRPALDRRVLLATAAGIATLAIVGLVISRPYIAVADAFPEVRHGPRTIAVYSGSPSCSSPHRPRTSSGAGRPPACATGSRPFPSRRSSPGSRSSRWPSWAPSGRRGRDGSESGLAIAVVAMAVLSLGFDDPGRRWLYPYGWFYELAPGWQAIRVPTRLTTFTTLGLALLAAGGATWVVARLRSAGRPRLAAVAAPLLVAVVLIEGCGFGIAEAGRPWLSGPDHPTVPRAPAGLAAVAAPQLHLPAAAAGQPALPAVVDRPVPGSRQRAQHAQSTRVPAPRARRAGLPRCRIGRPAAGLRRADRRPARRPRAGDGLGGLAPPSARRPAATTRDPRPARALPAGAGVSAGAEDPPRPGAGRADRRGSRSRVTASSAPAETVAPTAMSARAPQSPVTAASRPHRVGPAAAASTQAARAARAGTRCAGAKAGRGLTRTATTTAAARARRTGRIVSHPLRTPNALSGVFWKTPSAMRRAHSPEVVVVADQREGDRRGDHHESGGDCQHERQRRPPPPGHREAEGQERKHRNEEARTRRPAPERRPVAGVVHEVGGHEPAGQAGLGPPALAGEQDQAERRPRPPPASGSAARARRRAVRAPATDPGR